MMTNPRYLAGKFLLAMPGIGDLRFERAVIAMCSHDDQGALGIGIGHFVPRMGLHNLLSQFDIPTDNIIDAPVHQGGPVEPQRGFVLHSLDWGGQGTVQVNKLWGLSGTLDILRVIGRPQGPSKWLVALGYAGWGAGQLDGEMLISDGQRPLPAAALIRACSPAIQGTHRRAVCRKSPTNATYRDDGAFTLV
jgi:putative transcriptional regulator